MHFFVADAKTKVANVEEKVEEESLEQWFNAN
jgi:hypothetical protein